MICPKCSQVVPDESRFCTACGTSLEDVAETVVNEAEEAVDEVATEEDSAEESKNMATEEAAAEQVLGAASMASQEAPVQMGGAVGASAGVAGAAVKTAAGISKPVLFGLIGGGVFLVAAAVTLIVVGIISANRKTQINLADYTVVSYEGYDGYGTASIDVDESKLSKDVAKAMGIDVEDLQDMNFSDFVVSMEASGISPEKLQKLYQALITINVTLDKDSELSNGDKITVTYSFDEEAAADAKVEFIGDTEKRTVEGLDPIKEVDPFAELSVEFGGTAPQAYVNLTNNATEEPLNFTYFNYEPATGLSNGDTVTVKVTGYDENDYIQYYGVKFTQLEKTYTVEGVDEYITSADQLDETALETMKKSTQDYITEYFADSTRKSAIKASDVKYFGYYFLTNKEVKNAWSGYNKVYMILSAKVSSKEKPKQFKEKTVYFPIEFEDVKKLSDGTWDISSLYRYLLGSTELQYGFWSTVSGYTSIDDMKNDLVDANAANYTAIGYD